MPLLTRKLDEWEKIYKINRRCYLWGVGVFKLTASEMACLGFPRSCYLNCQDFLHISRAWPNGAPAGHTGCLPVMFWSSFICFILGICRCWVRSINTNICSLLKFGPPYFSQATGSKFWRPWFKTMKLIRLRYCYYVDDYLTGRMWLLTHVRLTYQLRHVLLIEESDGQGRFKTSVLWVSVLYYSLLIRNKR